MVVVVCVVCVKNRVNPRPALEILKFACLIGKADLTGQQQRGLWPVAIVNTESRRS